MAENLSITKKVELIDKRQFAAMALDENVKTFAVVYIATFLMAQTPVI